MLITGMFLGNTSYGASISDLLKSGKSIKLICTIEKANEWTWDRHSNGDLYIKDTKIDSLIGDKINYLIEVEGEESASLYVNGDKICCDEFDNPSITPEHSSVDEDKYEFSMKQVLPDNFTLPWSVEINRITGQFFSRRYTSLTKKLSVPFSQELKGDCEKASEKKF